MGSPWLSLSSNSARMNPTASRNLFKPLPALREPIFSTKSQTHLNRLQFSVRRGDNAVVTVRRATRNVFAPGDPLETESTSLHMHSEVSLRTRQSLSELPGRHQRGRSCADIHFRRSIMEAFCRENQRQQRGTRGSPRCNIPAKPRRGEFGHILRFFEILGRKWAHGGPGGVLKGPWRP